MAKFWGRGPTEIGFVRAKDSRAIVVFVFYGTRHWSGHIAESLARDARNFDVRQNL